MTGERLFGWEHAFDHPVTIWITAAAAAGLLLAPLLAFLLTRGETRKDVLARWRSWGILVPLIIGPILLGAACTIGAIALLSLLCYREYARATGLFRERLISLLVVLGILAVHFSVLDHWYGLFVALFPLATTVLCAGAILPDRPSGYIQRVSLGVFGFTLFGCSLGHLGYMANDPAYRPLLLMVVATVQLNDVFAYLAGKVAGRRRIAPNTSPNKTLGGSVGALLLTTPLVYLLGGSVFAGTVLDRPDRLLLLGLIVSVSGQLGDLLISSIKRDLGLKDIGTGLPGMGGLLDRFDSLLLAAPAVFHYVGYYVGIGLGEPTRILTGG